MLMGMVAPALRTVVMTAALTLLLHTGAQDSPVSLKRPGVNASIDTRVAVLEDNVYHLESQYQALSAVPVELAHIDEQLSQLKERNSGVASFGRDAVIALLGLGWGTRELIGARKREENDS